MGPDLQANVKTRLARLSPELAEHFMAGDKTGVEAALTDLSQKEQVEYMM